MDLLTNKKVKKDISFFDTEQLKGDMKQRAIRGGMITSASQTILFFLGLLSIVVLARLLTPENFGLIGMVTSLTVLIERFQELGLGDAIVQRKEITHEQVSTLFWINLGICSVLGIVVALSAKIVAWFYNDERLIWITVAFALNFVFSGLAIQHQALIRRRMRFYHFALIQILSTTFGFGVAIVLALLGYGYWALVWKELARTLLNTVLAWSFCPWRPSLPIRKAGVKSMLQFGGNVTGFNMLYYFSNNLDSILIGKFCGAAPVGLYSRAKRLTTIPLSQLLEPIRLISLPTLSALQDDPLKYRNYFEKMLTVLCFLYMPIIVYISIYAKPIVYLSLGSQWMGAVPLFSLLAISMFAYPIVVLLGMIMLSSGQARRFFFWGLFISSALVSGFAAGIKWGAIGVAASWPIAIAANLIFSLLFAFKGSPVQMVPTLKNIYRPAIASIGMGVVLLITYDFVSTFNVALQITSSMLLGCVVYFAIWLFFPGGYKSIIEIASYPLLELKRRKGHAQREF
jgi:O-antigen/teichoic acid export membrane protein